MLSQCCQRPFRPLTIFVLFTIFYEFFAVLIHAKISQMNKPFPHIFILHIILIGRKSSQPLLEHIDSQGIIASYNNVDPQIILEVVDQMRVVHVLRHQDIFFILYQFPLDCSYSWANTHTHTDDNE